MNLHLRLSIVFFSLILLSSRCKKQNAEPQLPPETTTGAMTFGCKVNARVLLPNGGTLGPGLSVEYQNLGQGIGGGWFLGVSGSDYQSNPKSGITINTDSLLLIEGTVYPMREAKGFAYATYQNGLNFYYIYPNDTGQLTITKHDQSQRILSGRFWFTATSVYDQTKVSITEGRFDVRY